MTCYLLGIKFDTVKTIWLLPFRIPPPAAHYYIRNFKKRNKILYLIFTHTPHTLTRTRINRLQSVLPLDISDKNISCFKNTTNHLLSVFSTLCSKFCLCHFVCFHPFVHMFDLSSLTPGPITF